MIVFAVIAAAIFITGRALTAVLWRRLDGDRAWDETTPCERAFAGAILGLALWLAVDWLLALTHTLTRTWLIGAAGVFVVTAAIVVVRTPIRRPRLDALSIAVLVPVALWLVFILWRGSVVPTDNHDALSYHLPKAVFMSQAHGWTQVVTGDARMVTLPINYEMLLADVLLLAGNDHLTEWIGTISYVVFLLGVGAVAERWWGRGRHTIAAVLLAAAAPVLLLHSGTDKNDLLLGVFAVGALLFGARWYARGGRMPWLLLIVTLAVGAGTKPNEAAILIGLAPFLLLRIVRLLRERKLTALDVALTVAVAAAAFILGGGMQYVFNVLHQQGAPLPLQVGSRKFGQTKPTEYGDWLNLLEFPLLLLIVPFSRHPEVWVPWRHDSWFWPRYEIYFSTFGVLMSLAVGALPLCVYRYRKDADAPTRAERMVFCAAAAIAFAVIVPVRFRPLGFFGTFTRYVVFVIPAIVGWTIAPRMRELWNRAEAKPAAVAAMIAFAAFFSLTAFDVARNDAFSPFKYAVDMARHPDQRRIFFNTDRAGLIVDRLAGPYDTIAVDASFDTWLYPAMGRDRTRRLEFIGPGPGPVVIPDDAQWVIVDRSWNAVWGNPHLTDLGKFWRWVTKGKPLPEDVRVLNALRRDPRFVEIYYHRSNQAVFRRRR